MLETTLRRRADAAPLLIRGASGAAHDETPALVRGLAWAIVFGTLFPLVRVADDAFSVISNPATLDSGRACFPSSLDPASITFYAALSASFGLGFGLLSRARTRGRDWILPEAIAVFALAFFLAVVAAEMTSRWRTHDSTWSAVAVVSFAGRVLWSDWRWPVLAAAAGAWLAARSSRRGLRGLALAGPFAGAELLLSISWRFDRRDAIFWVDAFGWLGFVLGAWAAQPYVERALTRARSRLLGV